MPLKTPRKNENRSPLLFAFYNHNKVEFLHLAQGLLFHPQHYLPTLDCYDAT